ncbi:MAG: hypothetical protein KDE27_10995 [Planctomycetes bacterium]|nr:hypothetical protein [Planctomycetota bacterium]
MSAPSPVLSFGLLTAALLCPRAAAQDAGSSLAAGLEPAVVPIHRVERPEGPSESGPLEAWAAGRDYKVAFHDRATFVPYLGSGYPHNLPLSWRTVSVRLGEHELLTPGETPLHSAADRHYEYRFAAVTEAYDVLAGGLEQTFVLRDRPVAGDLVIAGAVTTELTAADRTPAVAALTFCDSEGRAVVEYGAAVAIDAVGGRVPVTTGYRDGRIELTVPGAWLATAVLPVTVDPLLSAVLVYAQSSGSAMGSVDIAWQEETPDHNVMIAFVREASAADSDVYAIVCDDDYQNRVTVFTELSASWDSDGARCAFVGGADRWVIGYRRRYSTAAFQPSEVRCHSRSPLDLTPSQTSVGLQNPSNIDAFQPDVGGVASFGSGNRALVVYQRVTTPFGGTTPDEIWGSRFDPVNGVFGTPFLIMHDGSGDLAQPRVTSVARGGPSSWVCSFATYTFYMLGFPPIYKWRVGAKRISDTGVVATGTWWAASTQINSTFEEMWPVVAGNDGRYTVGYTSFQPSAMAVAERLDWPDNASAPTSVLPLETVAATDFNEIQGLAFDLEDRSHFALALRKSVSGVASAHAARLGYSGALTEGPIAMWSAGTVQVTGTACAYDGRNHRFLMAYAGNVSNQDRVYGRAFTYPAVTPATAGGIGCSGTVLTWSGNQQVGSEFERLNATGASAGALHFPVVSFATDDQPITIAGVGAGCRLLVDTVGAYLGPLPVQTGSNPSWSFPLPEWLPALTLHFQDWVLEGNVLRSTQRLSVPFAK